MRLIDLDNPAQTSDALDELIFSASERLRDAVKSGITVDGKTTTDKSEIAKYFGIGRGYVADAEKPEFKTIGNWKLSPIWAAIKIIMKK